MLQLLKYTQKIWDYPSLENVAIIGAQHLLESTLILFRALMERGLDPKSTFLLGKCYSSCHSVRNDFLEDGFNICEESFFFDSYEPFDCYYSHIAREFAKHSLAQLDFSKIKKLVVLDDGGYLISAIHTLVPENIPVVSIEQTSSGIRYLKGIDLKIPVLNVARSQAKLQLETPFIVKSALRRLHQVMPDLFSTYRSVLILGQGAVGKYTLNQLAQGGHEVTAYDPVMSPSLCLTEALQDKEVIIGCSGVLSLPFKEYGHLKKGAVLFSVSSSDREFEAHRFRQQFSRTNDCHQHFENEQLTLLQGGHPLNFWGSRNNMDLSEIQITLSLLMSAVFQAVQCEPTNQGILSIDEESEHLIMEAFRKLSITKFQRNEETLRKLIPKLEEVHVQSYSRTIDSKLSVSSAR